MLLTFYRQFSTIIGQHIVLSYLWAAYNTLGTLGYLHFDPITGACTNHIESVRQKAKQKHKQRYGTHRELENYETLI